MNDALEQITIALSRSYRIEREIGAGGMATVYLAHDLKHDRNVAIKVLHPDLGVVLGGERFLSEIKTTAKLQHPHILPLLDSGDAGGGLLYYVMPLVTGETLRTRLDREKQLPIADALIIAREVADALQYAHTQNVIHRDIKPENILLQDGHALVADFGIALAVQTAGGARLTQSGLSLGTPNYMSPEQAMGERTIDVRSDVYALGAVTYEMLGGAPPHVGSTAQAVVAKMLTEKPASLITHRDTVPLHVERAVMKALSRLPADRFASARAFVEMLDRATVASEFTINDAVPPVTSSKSARSSHGMLAAFALMAVVTVASTAAWWRAKHPVSSEFVQFRLSLPDSVHIAEDALPFAITRDGSKIVFAGVLRDGKRALYIRSLQSTDVVVLPGTNGAAQPTFSPDGEWIAFIAAGELKKARTDGSEMTTLAEVRKLGGMSWSSGGLIIVATDGRLASVPETGGALVLLEDGSASGGRTSSYPIALPDGKSVLFTESGVTGSRTMYRSLKSAASIPIGLNTGTAIAIVNGWVISSGARGVVSATQLSRNLQKVIGAPRQVADGVATLNGLASFAVSQNGTFVYWPNTGLSDVVFAGSDTVSVADERRNYEEPRLSPDGRRIAVTVDSRDRREVWVVDIATRIGTRLTNDGNNHSRGEWTPSGDHVLFRTGGRGRDSLVKIHEQQLNGGPITLVQANSRLSLYEATVSPNGEWLLYRSGGGAASELRYRHLTGDTTSQPFSLNQNSMAEARFSPDGKWVAYRDDESGRAQVYIRPFPTGEIRLQISVDGGVQPVWSASGKELYYVGRQGGVLLRAQITEGAPLAVVRRDTLIRGGFSLPAGEGHATYDVAKDGRLLLVRRALSTTLPVVTTNWFDRVTAPVAK